MVVVAALAAMALWPALAAAGQKVISTAGPLSSIYIDEDLACQAQVSGDASPTFYGLTEPGGCGTFLALTEGEGVTGEGHHRLFGPDLSDSAGITTEADYKVLAQTLTGSGTEASPFVVSTRVGAYEPEVETEIEVAELTETDSYVAGQGFYTTRIAVKNPSTDPRDTLKGTVYHVGDCFLANEDTGFGAVNAPSAGSVACTLTPNDAPPARLMAFTPLATEGAVGASHYVESAYPTFWDDISPTGVQLPDTIDATTDEDNGMGLSWPIEAKGGQTDTLSLATTVSSPSPVTSSTTAGPCVPSGQVTVSVSAGLGPKAVYYAVDGGAPQSTEVNEAGQATIALTPGQHTLEYWAEDQGGVQEEPHHKLSVLAASGAPTLTISSDEGRASYEVGETASVTIAASGAGLTSNPSKIGEPISTSTPGAFAVSRSAANACGTTTASFSYTVIPPPVLGKTANVDLVSGKVYVALPSTAYASFAPGLEDAVESLSKGLKFIPLTEARQVPIGSTLETTAGVARITTATASKGKTQSGEFGAGIFKLLQNRKQKGLTEMSIIDNRSSKQVCASVGKKKAQTASKHLSNKTLGRLTGSGHGSFTTRGQYSAATVRGTVWGVRNQCNGTLTKVTRGVVVVRDFRRRKTITLFTGQTYLAKAPL
jgi:hypothetical protein